MKNSKEFAALWREKMAQEEPTVEREFGGFRGMFRRLPIAGWFKAGKVPQFLVHALMKARADGSFEHLQDESLSPEELSQSVEFQRKVVCQVCVNPKVVAEDRPLEEHEISYTELAEHCPDVVDLIVGWVLAGSPDIPVRMNDDSEVTVAEVESFRSGGKDQTAIGSGLSSPAV